MKKTYQLLLNELNHQNECKKKKKSKTVGGTENVDFTCSDTEENENGENSDLSNRLNIKNYT